MDTAAMFAALMSHAAASGHFDRVNGSEPSNAPGRGVTVAFWLDSLRPLARQSGLAATSARVGFSARLYVPMTADNADTVDLTLARAVDALMTAYSGDFTLGELVADVDLLGRHGDPLACAYGHLPWDGAHYRAATLTIPIVINDAWTQAP